MCFKLKDMNIHSLQDIETELLAKNTALTFLHVACCQDERCCKDERIFSINYILTISVRVVAILSVNALLIYI